MSILGAGTAVTVLQTAQHTDVALAGYMRRFWQPVQTSWLCAPEICISKSSIQRLNFQLSELNFHFREPFSGTATSE
jgi:hypothetical protein